MYKNKAIDTIKELAMESEKYYDDYHETHKTAITLLSIIAKNDKKAMQKYDPFEGRSTIDLSEYQMVNAARIWAEN